MQEIIDNISEPFHIPYYCMTWPLLDKEILQQKTSKGRANGFNVFVNLLSSLKIKDNYTFDTNYGFFFSHGKDFYTVLKQDVKNVLSIYLTNIYSLCNIPFFDSGLIWSNQYHLPTIFQYKNVSLSVDGSVSRMGFIELNAHTDNVKTFQTFLSDSICIDNKTFINIVNQDGSTQTIHASLTEYLKYLHMRKPHVALMPIFANDAIPNNIMFIKWNIAFKNPKTFHPDFTFKINKSIFNLYLDHKKAARDFFLQHGLLNDKNFI